MLDGRVDLGGSLLLLELVSLPILASVPRRHLP
jgi:hypothetical protein